MNQTLEAATHLYGIDVYFGWRSGWVQSATFPTRDAALAYVPTYRAGLAVDEGFRMRLTIFGQPVELV